MPTIEAVATAAPGPPVPQAETERFAENLFTPENPALRDYLPVYRNGGIKERHFVLPVEAYLEPMGWKARSRHFTDGGLALMEEVTAKVLAEAGIDATDVDGIVFVTTTGIATPSLDARLADRMGFRADLHRVPVWGLGCAGGVAGLRLASDLATARPGSRYLLVSLELCSLAFRLDDASLRAFVANALFADGCAAALVTSDPDVTGQAEIGATASHQWPDSRDVMGWTVEDEGLGVVFSKKIPAILSRDLPDVVGRFLDGAAPDRFVLHPGGAKVLEAYEESLGLSGEALLHAREVLAHHGNMSSPTVLFVLERALKDGLSSGEEALMAAVGPGFTAEMAMLRGTGPAPALAQPVSRTA